MKKRYYLSMVSLFPLFLIYHIGSLFIHKSFELFAQMSSIQLFLFGVLSLIAAVFIYRPVDRYFKGDHSPKARIGVEKLTKRSTMTVFLFGSVFVLGMLIPLFFSPDLLSTSSEISMEKMPMFYNLAVIPPSFYIFAVFSVFILNFFVFDLSLNMKAEAFRKFGAVRLKGKEKEIRVYSPKEF